MIKETIYKRFGLVEESIYNRKVAELKTEISLLKENIKKLEYERAKEADYALKLQIGFQLAISEFPKLNLQKEKEQIGYWISQAIVRQKEEDAKLLYQEPNFFSFSKLDNRSIQRVLCEDIDNKELAIALKGSTDEVRDVIFANLSKRLATMIKEDMNYMGPVRKTDVDEVRIKISKIIRRLIESGEIIFNVEKDTIII